jgi:capsular exopolysaccharide synthesis family protein
MGTAAFAPPQVEHGPELGAAASAFAELHETIEDGEIEEGDGAAGLFFDAEDVDWYALVEQALPEETSPQEETGRNIVPIPLETPEVDPRREQERILGRLRELEEDGLIPSEALAGMSTPAPAQSGAGLEGDPTRRTGSLLRDGLAAARGAAVEEAAAPAVQATSRTFDPEEPTQAISVTPAPAIREGTTGVRRLRADEPAPARSSSASARLDERAVTGRQHVSHLDAREMDPGLVAAIHPTSLAADRFRQLYHSIFVARGGTRPPRTVLVTSCLSGEGKTTVATNLAAAAARVTGRGALLIDADHRGASLLRALGLPPVREGLLDLLSSSKTVEEYLLELPLERLDLLPRGLANSRAPDLLTSPAMGGLLQTLSDCFADRDIIIDGPPVHVGPEALVIARHVQYVLLVVRAGATTRPLVSRALDILRQQQRQPNEPQLGVLLNDVR